MTIPSDSAKPRWKRTLKLCILEACERLWIPKTVTPEFWRQYFEEVQRPVQVWSRAIRQGTRKLAPGFFEYLTRPEVVEAVIDDAMSRSAAA